jgi:hypothetical protein
MAGYAWTFRRKEKGMFEIIHVERVEPRGGYRLALVSLIDSFGEQLSQVFMLRVFDVDTDC